MRAVFFTAAASALLGPIAVWAETMPILPDPGADAPAVEVRQRLSLDWDGPRPIEKVTVAVDPAGPGAEALAVAQACGDGREMGQGARSASGTEWTFVILCALPRR
ncbi:MAG: hypothetical protein ACU0CO_00540 [Shimia sp.]